MEQKNIETLLNLDNALNDIDAFCEKIEKSRDSLINNSIFMNKININQFTDLIFKCSAGEVSRIRRMIAVVYEERLTHHNNEKLIIHNRSKQEMIKTMFPEDEEYIDELCKCLINKYNSFDDDDRLRAEQIELLYKQLNKILNNYRRV